MEKPSRLEKIILFLKQHNLATVDDLVTITQASPATIRRDILKLHQQGIINRAHGGVALNRFISSLPTIHQKQKKHLPEKISIAKYAASLVKPDQSVVLDAGTTTLEIAKYLTEIPLTVFTPDLHIALYLSAYEHINVTVVGGTMDKTSQSCIGQNCLTFLSKINPDVAFVSSYAWSIEKGVTCPTEDKATLKKAVIQNARTRIMVTDSSKYNQHFIYHSFSLDELSLIITDKHLENQLITFPIEIIYC